MTSFLFWSFWVFLILGVARDFRRMFIAITDPNEDNSIVGIVAALWLCFRILVMYHLYNAPIIAEAI